MSSPLRNNTMSWRFEGVCEAGVMYSRVRTEKTESKELKRPPLLKKLSGIYLAWK